MIERLRSRWAGSSMSMSRLQDSRRSIEFTGEQKIGRRQPFSATASNTHKRTDRSLMRRRPPVRHDLEIWRARHNSNV